MNWQARDAQKTLIACEEAGFERENAVRAEREQLPAGSVSAASAATAKEASSSSSNIILIMHESIVQQTQRNHYGISVE